MNLRSEASSISFNQVKPIITKKMTAPTTQQGEPLGFLSLGRNLLCNYYSQKMNDVKECRGRLWQPVAAPFASSPLLPSSRPSVRLQRRRGRVAISWHDVLIHSAIRLFRERHPSELRVLRPLAMTESPPPGGKPPTPSTKGGGNP